MRRFLCALLTVLLVGSLISPIRKAFASGVVDEIVVSQAGYSQNDFKVAYALADDVLGDPSFQILLDDEIVYSGVMEFEDVTWGQYVYVINFSDLSEYTGENFQIETNEKNSFTFQIKENNWSEYRKDVMTYYRVQRAHVATEDSMTGEYENTKLSSKAYHLAGHLDDAWSPDKQKHYDLTGGWYDAGDYGIYSENQWVAGQIALAYLRHSNESNSIVDFDYDGNDIPDLLDEAYVGSLYGLKVIDAFGGLAYNVRNRIKDGSMGGWTFPYALDANGNFDPKNSVTDNIIADDPFADDVDDRIAERPSVEGSAKIAGMLAAVSRAYEASGFDQSYEPINLDINAGVRDSKGNIIPGKEDEVYPVESFKQAAKERAIIAYNYAYNHQDGPRSNYFANGGVVNPLLWAEVELYLLTNEKLYYERAIERIMSLTFSDLRGTNYWDLRPISMIELYPVVDSEDDALKKKIKELLKSRIDYFMYSSLDTPYGVLNEFSDFGVNEPHVSYIGDVIRYYEVFKDEDPEYAAEILRAAKKGLYWVFGNNPWNISWVSGVGQNYTKHLHSRFDPDAYDMTGKAGVIIPGAMICGPNLKNPGNAGSINPWYEDLSLGHDGASQWRYNEHSISIQVGLLYSIMALSSINDNPEGEISFAKTKLLTPQIGDKVTGEVSIHALPGAGVTNVEMAIGSATSNFKPMTKVGDLYYATLDVTDDAPYSSKRIVLRSTLEDGYSYSTEHIVKAADLPDASERQLYDDMDGSGVFGSKKINNWVMWWANGGPPTSGGSSPKSEIDGRVVKTLTTPRAPSEGSVAYEGQFRPEGDLPDWNGFKYLYINAKNTGDAELKFVVEVKPGKRSQTITLPVNADWTEYKYDLDELFRGTDHKANEFYIWVIPGAGNIGKLSIDTIEVGNEGAIEHTPQLIDSNVSDLDGDERSTFHFKTTYMSPVNRAPFAVQAVIDGVIHEMVEEDGTDDTYDDGKTYILSKELTRGNHQFYFRTSDQVANFETEKTSDLIVNEFIGEPAAPKAPGHLRIIEKDGDHITLKWDASRGEMIPEKYEIFDGTKKLGEVESGQTTFTIPNEGPYELNVIANYESNRSDPSNIILYDGSTESFPHDFTLIGPQDDAASLENITELTWETSSNAESYTLVVSKNKDYSSPFIHTNIGKVATYQLAGLEFSTTYYWKVIAHNKYGDTVALNEGSKFTTRAPINQEAVRYEARVALTGPNERKATTDHPGTASALTNGWAKRYAKGDITWQAHFPETGSYDFTVRVFDEFDRPQEFSIKVDGVEVTPRYSMSSKDRKWKDFSGTLGNITAGNHTISVAYHTNTAGVNLFLGFLDVYGSAPGIFQLKSPINGAESQSIQPVLNWEQTIAGISYSPFGANNYTLVVAEQLGFSNPIFSKNVGAGTNYQLANLDYETKYYWKVIAHGENGDTESNIFTFTTEESPKPVAEIIAKAIEDLPKIEDITIDDKIKVEAARELVEIAIKAGAIETDFTNLQKLIDIEKRMSELEKELPIVSEVYKNIKNQLSIGKDIDIDNTISKITITNKTLLKKEFASVKDSAMLNLKLSSYEKDVAVKRSNELHDSKNNNEKYEPIGLLLEFDAAIIEESSVKTLKKFGQKVDVVISLSHLELNDEDIKNLRAYKYDTDKLSWDYAGGKVNYATNTIEFSTAETGIYSVFYKK